MNRPPAPREYQRAVALIGVIFSMDSGISLMNLSLPENNWQRQLAVPRHAPTVLRKRAFQ
ncbi:hypothetical protein Poly21_44830 [Allorhodopirellula heiligendammensis]|uniref:Uncharacterized protein n=1 Tax=Allorhodopirellula heiligendammensis TaxID=2714739 RepID=A0A5C6BEU9_9BACT|nr:hypothetical protein Poly21_44830 [Allorhodopirellula heiligendammensis]